MTAVTHSRRISRTPFDDEERASCILAAALEVFGERGLHATRLTHVARRARLSFSALKQCYPTVPALFREAVRQTVINVLPLSLGEIAGASATEMLLELSRSCWTLMRSPRFVVLQRLVLADLRAAPDLSHLFIGEVVAPLCRMAEQIIAAGVERGEFRSANAAGAARLMISTLLGQSLWYGHPEFFRTATGCSEPAALGEVQELLLRCVRGEGPSPPPHLQPRDAG